MPHQMLRFMSARFRSPEGDPPGGGGNGDPPKEPETFPREYVRLLREESKGHRLKAQEQEQLRKTAEERATKAETESKERETQTRTAADQRVMRAELKAVAIKAGIVDVDGLKLLDLSKLKLNADGEVEGAEELIAEAKKSKPYLFAQSSNTSNPGKPPKKDDPGQPKSARDMTDTEWAEQKKKLGLR